MARDTFESIQVAWELARAIVDMIVEHDLFTVHGTPYFHMDIKKMISSVLAIQLFFFTLESMISAHMRHTLPREWP